MSIYESTTCNSLLTWASITNYFVDFSDILFQFGNVYNSPELNDLNFCYRDSQLQVGENSYIPHFMLKSSSKIDDIFQWRCVGLFCLFCWSLHSTKLQLHTELSPRKKNSAKFNSQMWRKNRISTIAVIYSCRKVDRCFSPVLWTAFDIFNQH